MSEGSGTVRLWHDRSGEVGDDRISEFPPHIVKVATLVDEDIHLEPGTGE